MAQKPVIDSTAIHQWVSLENDNLAINNDGKYVVYGIQNQPIHSNTLVIQSTENVWKREFPGASYGFFSADGKQYIFSIKDTLCFFDVSTHTLSFIPGVADYQPSYLARGEWMYWRLKETPDELVLHHLLTGKERKYSSVQTFVFNKQQGRILLKTSTGLQLADLTLNKTIQVSRDSSITGYAIDDSGIQVAFVVREQLWYYKTGMDKAVLKVSDQANADLHISGTSGFSDNGKYIFFELGYPKLPKPGPDALKLDIWNYKDPILQSAQLNNLQPVTYTAVIATDDQNVIRLQREGETSKMPPIGDFMVFGKNTMGDRYWLNQRDSNWLISLKDGSRKLLQTKERFFLRSSPSGNYLIYFDSDYENNYFSYDLHTGKLVNISAGINQVLAVEDRYQRPVEKYPFPVGIAAWLPEDKGILVYDNYDIWRLDLKGKNKPLNITNGYGHLHHIKFRLLNDRENTIHDDSTALLLMAYNTLNKQNGFYYATKNNPEALIMGPHIVDLYGTSLYAMNDHDYDKGMIPLKASHANIWIVKKQSTTEAPNYFITSNFKTYKALTQLAPQKKYNWLTAELVTFTQLDGTKSQGVLYKPENFDSTKKYPVLFNYYEQMSHRLYQYPTPDFTRHNINVAWFVSHGYLVFTPDICFIKGRIGKSALNSVAGAALYLSKLPYVDKQRMGINGHSSGGYLTNYIITHTTLFAAAIEGAGTSDAISSALQLSVGASRLSSAEYNLGSLWQHKSLWLEESPIMNADKVTTPLIIFHSKIDGAVPWEQAVELFVALRRLNKKVWMLQYDEENHGAWSKEDSEDYTIRITQFFDHYLKGAPAPMWMTRGVPARLKGIDRGYELDTSKNQP